MKTLQEIKNILLPKEDLVEVTKSLILQKCGEGKLVTLNLEMYFEGDSYYSLNGLAVVNGKLIAFAIKKPRPNTYCLGEVYDGVETNETNGIGIPIDCLIAACHRILGLYDYNAYVDFDFNTMKKTSNCHLWADHEEIFSRFDQEKLRGVLDGKTKLATHLSL